MRHVEAVICGEVLGACVLLGDRKLLSFRQELTSHQWAVSRNV